MKLRLFTVLSSGASAIVLSSAAHAAYTGLIVELSDFYFANHPNQAVRDAWNAGPDSQFHIYRLYATFNSNTPADRVNAWAGIPGSPFHVVLQGGLFHNYVEFGKGEPVHFNGAYTGIDPIERSWDTYATIGDAISFPVGELTGTGNLGYNSSVIGPADNVGLFITPNDASGRATATAPGQAPAPAGVYRVLLAQFVVQQSVTNLSGTLLLNANGENLSNQTFAIPASSALACFAVAGLTPRRRRFCTMRNSP